MADTAPVTLNASQMTLNTNDITLVRTAQTPKKVKLTVEVPIGSSVCTQYGQVPVFGQAPECGYDRVYAGTEQYCVRWEDTPPPPPRGGGDNHGPGDHGPGPGNGPGNNGPRPGQGPGNNGPRPVRHAEEAGQVQAQDRVCVQYESRPVYRSVMRSCEHNETRCVATGISTESVSKKVAIVFKNAPLSGSDTETYQLSLDQKQLDSSSVTYQLQATQTKNPVSISYWNFLWHTITVKGE